MPRRDPNRYTFLLEAGPMEARLIQARLQAAGIVAHIESEHHAVVHHQGPRVTPRVCVRAADVPRAVRLLRRSATELKIQPDELERQAMAQISAGTLRRFMHRIRIPRFGERSRNASARVTLTLFFIAVIVALVLVRALAA